MARENKDVKYTTVRREQSSIVGVTEKMINNFYSKIKINKNTKCWDFTGCIDRYGYGNFGTLFGKKAHRFSYQLHVDDLDNNLTIDHVCKNKKCVNPEHLDQVPIGENLERDPNHVSTINSHKTHCKRGHLLKGYNLKIRKTKEGVKRNCRKCINLMNRILRKKKRMECKKNKEVMN